MIRPVYIVMAPGLVQVNDYYINILWLLCSCWAVAPHTNKTFRVSDWQLSGGANPGAAGSDSCRGRKCVFVEAACQDIQTGNRKSLERQWYLNSDTRNKAASKRYVHTFGLLSQWALWLTYSFPRPLNQNLGLSEPLNSLWSSDPSPFSKMSSQHITTIIVPTRIVKPEYIFFL